MDFRKKWRLNNKEHIKEHDHIRNSSEPRKKWRREYENNRRRNPEWNKKRNEWLKEWRSKNKVRMTILRKKQYNPFKQHARSKLNYEIRIGHINRPKNCENCGIKCIPHGHHHMGYENPLKVMWLCSLCHGEIHSSIH